MRSNGWASGPDQLLEANPSLVYALVTGYGTEGPDADRAGYDVGGFWARTGVAATLAPEGQPPPNIRGGFGDHATALAMLSGILGALLEREHTGRGQLVETSLLRTGVYCLGWDLGMQMRFGRLAAPRPRTEEINPLVNCYSASDGKWFWLLGVESQRHWPNVCRAIGREDLLEDERFVDARGRRHNAGACIAALDAAVRPRHARCVDRALRRARGVVGAGLHARGGRERPAGDRRRRVRRCARR